MTRWQLPCHQIRHQYQSDLLWHDCQGSALAREAMSSAAVTLYAAAVLPGVPPSVSATDLASGLFLPPDSAVQFAALGASGQLALHIHPLHDTVSAGIGQLSVARLVNAALLC